MEYIKVSAKTVEDAIIEAAIQLGTSSDNIEYEVIQAASSGFFGIGGKKAIIQARKKAENSLDFEDVIKDPLKEVVPKKEAAPQKESVKKPAKKFQKEQTKKADKKPEKKNEKKQEKPAVKQAEKKAEQPKTEEKAAPAKEKAPVDKEAAQAAAKEFLNKTFAAMDMQVEIKTSFDKEDNLNIELTGGDMGILIGKRGQTLDSIQYLTSLVVNKGNGSYVRVKVDTENYRARRKETLENLAKNIAFKVKRTRKPVFLEPMNPYERRIIHSALQNDPQVSTHSEGEEPYRKVVVTLKK